MLANVAKKQLFQSGVQGWQDDKQGRAAAVRRRSILNIRVAALCWEQAHAVQLTGTKQDHKPRAQSWGAVKLRQVAALGARTARAGHVKLLHDHSGKSGGARLHL